MKALPLFLRWSMVLELWLCMLHPLCAQEFIAHRSESLEYKVKGAYLYNFAKFVEWPNTATLSEKAVVIGILGKDPFGPVLEQILDGKTANNKQFIVRRALRAEELAACNIVFIGDTSDADLKATLKSLQSMPALTIGEGP